jgi:cellobiose phosphorylase
LRYGYFDNENREYVIDRVDVPVSWTNYLGVKDMCTVVSHNAGGYSFYKNAEHKRITRFRANGVPLDRPGHYVYLRDDDTGEYWSVSWQPVGKSLDQAKYECRHGLSYSKFSCDYQDIHAEQTLFIPIDDDVELWDVKIRNTGAKPRRLSVFGYVEFSFHHIEIDNQNLQMSLYASGANCQDGVIEYDFFYEPSTFHYFTGSFTPTVTTPCATVFSAATARRPTRSPSSRESATAAPNWAATTAELCKKDRDARARRRIPPGLHARRGPKGKRKRDPKQIFRSGQCRQGVCRAEELLAEEARRFPVQDPASRARHHGQHLDALPGGDLRRLVALCIVH